MNKLKLKIARFLAGKDYAVIPVKPARELLLSMAFRENHAFGAPSYFNSDEEILKARDDNSNPWLQLQAKQTLTEAEKEGSIVTMRQLHEEVVGRGFYTHNP